MNDHTHISRATRDRILNEVAASGTPRDTASLVLDLLVEEELDLPDSAVDLEEVKQLLVEALRASRGGDRPTRGQKVG